MADHARGGSKSWIARRGGTCADPMPSNEQLWPSAAFPSPPTSGFSFSAPIVTRPLAPGQLSVPCCAACTDAAHRPGPSCRAPRSAARVLVAMPTLLLTAHTAPRSSAPFPRRLNSQRSAATPCHRMARPSPPRLRRRSNRRVPCDCRVARAVARRLRCSSVFPRRVWRWARTKT